jgi:threonine synthase
MWRFASVLPVDEGVTLGEGDTPLVHLERAGRSWGLDALYAKNEATNPTWSHKDRLASVTVSTARRLGARVVAAASTGNHGAAVAAYAARAGMRCVIATLDTVSPAMKHLMCGYGAIVVATPTSEDRYELVNAGVEAHGWYPASNVTAPAVGSDAYGIAGYKTIAYELVEELGTPPDWLVVPVAYGDCLAGVAQGFLELRAAGVTAIVPRIVGAELFGVLQGALDGGPLGPVPTRPSAAFSIAGAYTTHQAVAALQAVDGFARSVTEDELATARSELGRSEGLYVEAAAAAAFAVARAIADEGLVHRDDRVVCLLTSTGLKDRRPQEADVAMTAPGLDALRSALSASGQLDDGVEADVFGHRVVGSLR